MDQEHADGDAMPHTHTNTHTPVEQVSVHMCWTQWPLRQPATASQGELCGPHSAENCHHHRRFLQGIYKSKCSSSPSHQNTDYQCQMPYFPGYVCLLENYREDRLHSWKESTILTEITAKMVRLSSLPLFCHIFSALWHPDILFIPENVQH